MQPVVGALLGWLLLIEHIGTSFFIGGGIILAAVLIALQHAHQYQFLLYSYIFAAQTIKY